MHPQLVRQCYHGRRELTAYRDRCDLSLGDSEFNRQELETPGFSPTDVLPVVPDFTHLAGTPDARVLDAYDDEWTNILFVGRLIPNKRPDDIIRSFHAYKTLYNPRARLLLAGSYGGFDRYLVQLHALIARFEEARNVSSELRDVFGADKKEKAVFMARVGAGAPPTSRSLRLPLNQLMITGGDA